MWQVYILQCKDKTLYTGVTVDLERRLTEHNESKKGAKYTKARRPVKLVYSRRFRSRATATAEEARIKKMKREDKIKLIEKTKSL
jgi:putative endonuclease